MNTIFLSRTHLLAGIGRNLARVKPGRLVIAASLSMLAACVSTQSLKAGESQLSDILIGQEREKVMDEASHLGADDAQCETQKTGVGVNRRAYFLETCSWQKPAKFSFCGQHPESVEYAFLEGRLVAAMLGFADADQTVLNACIAEQAAAGGYSAEAGELAAGQSLKLSNTATKTAVTVSEASVVWIIDSETAPKVHLLRDRL